MTLPLAGAPPAKGFPEVESAVTPLHVNGHKGRGEDDATRMCAESDHVVFASFLEIEAREYTVESLDAREYRRGLIWIL
jgi:hypothetical protein